MRHIISMLLQNEAGALARVAGMFSARGYNIDSLTVAATHDPQVSRLTMVTFGDDAVIAQIIKQSRKYIDVLEIADLTMRDHLECELLVVKVAATAANAPSIARFTELNFVAAAVLCRSVSAATRFASSATRLSSAAFSAIRLSSACFA